MVLVCRMMVLLVLLALVVPCSVGAGEFLIFDQVFTFDETVNGFNWFMPPASGPDNWKSPDDYENGQVYTRFEIISQPTNAACKLQFGFWQDGGGRETMSPHCELRGPGVITHHTSPATWWELDPNKPADFSRVGDIKHCGIIVWSSDPVGYISTYHSNPKVWENRHQYYPMKVRATVVAVSEGGQFSGWDHWVGDGTYASAPKPSQATFDFQHHFIRSTMPTEDWFHSVVLADFDRDGDLDYTLASAHKSGRLDDNFFWYEYRGPDDWAQHLIGSMAETQQAAALLDVDGDGWMDVISGNHWYRNSHDPTNTQFAAHQYRNLETGFHDVAAKDINGDGRPDIITLSENHGCYWYEQPENPSGLWPERQITPAEKCAHGSFGPEGIDDIDGDGDNDIILGDRWAENKNRGAAWDFHVLPFGHWTIPTWGGPAIMATRSVIRDMDGDGDNDIVITDCDVPDCVTAILYNENGGGTAWRKVILPQTAPGKRISLHSLRVEDFNGDGKLDILTVEQEDCRGKGTPPPPRWYIWENTAGVWTEHVILDANLGGHEAWTGDVDGDGDIDIITKTWRSGIYPGSANAGKGHADFLENKAID
jgi:FG-GAP-like repeat